MTKQREIKLVPAPEKSTHGDYNLFVGRKAVMVDGVLYGYALYCAAGRNGAYYTFEQAGGETIQDRRLVGKNKVERFYPVEVWSDQTAQRREGYDAQSEKRPESRLAAFKVRLLATAIRLVDEGRLIPESVQRERVAAAEKAIETAEKRAEARKAAAWRKRAAACLNDEDGIPLLADQAAVVDKIVAAMKWAQTQ